MLLGFLILLEGGATATKLPPLHATFLPSSSSAWTCNAGYFATAGGVCRACSVGACPPDMQTVPCTPTQDTSCVACPALPLGAIYVASSDAATSVCNDRLGCADGWLLSLAAACIPCPLGHFCWGGGQQVEACGDGCTTAGPGASGYLECIASANTTLVGFTVQSFIFFATPIAEDGSGCAAPFDRWVESWLIHGAYQGSSFEKRSPMLGVLSYVITVPRCTAARLLDGWLRPAILGNQADAIPIIAACTGAGVLMLNPPLISASPFLSGPQQPNAGNGSSLGGGAAELGGDNNTSSALLVIERRRWGQSHYEWVWTLGFVVASLLGLCVGLCAACALAFTRAHRRSLGRRYAIAPHPRSIRHIWDERGNLFLNASAGGRRGTDVEAHAPKKEEPAPPPTTILVGPEKEGRKKKKNEHPKEVGGEGEEEKDGIALPLPRALRTQQQRAISAAAAAAAKTAR